jgi:hypothetical protein
MVAVDAALTMAPPSPPPTPAHEQEQEGTFKKRAVLNNTILFLWQFRHAAKLSLLPQ